MEKLNLKELTEDYNLYVKRVQEGTIIIAENFRKKNISDGLQSIKDFVEGINWFISVTKYFNVNGIATIFDELKVVGFLDEINEALTVQDYFLVADLFEYEIAEYFGNLPTVTINN